jgi:hypothetical protein
MMRQPEARRLRRLGEELEESGLPLGEDEPFRTMLLDEIERALRPPVHERHVPSSGTILEPGTDPDSWTSGTQLRITHTPVTDDLLPISRYFVDGLSSWLIRRTGGSDEWLLFDRPAGSERDLVVLAEVLAATIVQRHPSGVVRVAGAFGVLRFEGLSWHYEPPVATWVDTVAADAFTGDHEVIEAMLLLAVHELGALGIGALLIYRPSSEPGPTVEERLPTPPPLRIRTASHLAPLRHALAQVDGAAMFDAAGTLRRLGVVLLPTISAKNAVDGIGGTRLTAGLRYSHDEPLATVISVSADGPVSVLRNGTILKRSAT